MSIQEINRMPQEDFMTYIVGTICDYAKANELLITDTVRTIGKNLVALTRISTFDNWKGDGNEV